MRVITKETPGTVTAGAASQVALAANRLRKYAEIANPTAVGMFLGFGRAAVVGEGAYIPPQSVYVVDADNLWVERIEVIAASGAGHVLATSEWQ